MVKFVFTFFPILLIYIIYFRHRYSRGGFLFVSVLICWCLALFTAAGCYLLGWSHRKYKYIDKWLGQRIIRNFRLICYDIADGTIFG